MLGVVGIREVAAGVLGTKLIVLYLMGISYAAEGEV